MATNFNSKIVSIELAKLLKLNGFNEEVKFRIYEDGMIASSSYLKNYNEEPTLYSAPTILEAVEWIEEKYNVFFEVSYHQRNFDMGNKFNYTVIDVTKDLFYGNVMVSSLIVYKTKYDALKHAMIAFLEKYGYKAKEEPIEKKENIVEEKKEEIKTITKEIDTKIKQKKSKLRIISD